MPRWLIIIIIVFFTLFLITLGGAVYYLKYGIASEKLRHIFTLSSGQEIPNSLTSSLTWVQRHKTEISLHSLISMPASSKIIDWPKQGTSIPMMKNTTIHYSAKADKTVIRLVTPKKCTTMFRRHGFRLFYNKFKVCRQNNKDPNTITESEDFQRSNDHWPALCIK